LAVSRWGQPQMQHRFSGSKFSCRNIKATIRCLVPDRDPVDRLRRVVLNRPDLAVGQGMRPALDDKHPVSRCCVLDLNALQNPFSADDEVKVRVLAIRDRDAVPPPNQIASDFQFCEVSLALSGQRPLQRLVTIWTAL
jgi:hypothetical protein